MRIWWCARYERSEHSEAIEWCKAEHIPVGEKCGPMRLIPDNAETVERIAFKLYYLDLGRPIPGMPEETWKNASPLFREKYLEKARAILAALDGETP